MFKSNMTSGRDICHPPQKDEDFLKEMKITPYVPEFKMLDDDEEEYEDGYDEEEYEEFDDEEFDDEDFD